MFYPFAVEQYLSDFEQGVDYHFSESGVEPVKFGELLELAGLEPEIFLDTPINYPEVNGFRSLRERIASFYPGAGPDNVLVTVGASEANYIIAQTLFHEGGELVTMQPTYLQITGGARNLGATVKTVPLIEEDGWALDTDALNSAVSDETTAITIVNPNNPTGHIMVEQEREAVITAAEKAGCWLITDEVYAGAEREGDVITPTLYGRYEKTLAVGSMSKAYGLPGLRLGWVVGPEEMIRQLWRRHEYATVSTTIMANKLAEIALSPDVRPKLIERTRGLIRTGFDILTEELNTYQGVFSVIPPGASAISFVKYNLPIGSTDFAHRLREEKSVLVVPGDCFGLDHHLRISFALLPDHLRAGLRHLNEVVDDIQQRA